MNNVLFLRTGNSARSIMAECAINRWGNGKFIGFSAGSHPKGAVHPLTIELLNELNYETKDLRSKSWDEFVAQEAPRLDFVFTVCDQAAAEQCPFFGRIPRLPRMGEWRIPQPLKKVNMRSVASFPAFTASSKSYQDFHEAENRSARQLRAPAASQGNRPNQASGRTRAIAAFPSLTQETHE